MSRDEKIGSQSEMNISQERFDTQSETGILPSGPGDGGNRVTIVLLAVAIVVSIIAIILAAVALHRPVSYNKNFLMTSDAQTSGPSNNKIWTIAVGHDWGAYEYFDDEGYIKGFNLQFPLAVCKEAGMDCRIVWDRYSNCYDSKAGEHAVGGQGLFDRWYDACAGWAVTVGRNHTFAFSEPFLEIEKSIFLVKKGDAQNFNGADLKGKTIVFLDGWGYDEKCLARHDNHNHKNYVLPKENIIHVSSAGKAVDLLLNGTAYALFADQTTLEKYSTVEAVPNLSFSCFLAGNGMMTRQDSDFNYYFNIGFRKFRERGGFEALCKQAQNEHGAQGFVNCKQY